MNICGVPDVNTVLLDCPVEVSPVTLELDLDNLFQLDNLVLSFKVGYSLPSPLDHMNLFTSVFSAESLMNVVKQLLLKSSLIYLYYIVYEMHLGSFETLTLVNIHLFYFVGSSSQCLYYREDTGQWQDVAACSLPGH